MTDTNEPPNAEDDVVTTPYETPITVPVIDNDVDPDGDPLTVAEVTQGLQGTCSITDDNQILYEPNSGYIGPDICPYVVCDDSDECATANVFVEVENCPPNAEDDLVEVAPDTPVTVDVSANDEHCKDDSLEVVDVSQPDNGKCEIDEDGNVVYTPDLGFEGSDKCTYTICVEGTQICSEADVIVGTLDPPVANDDNTWTTPETAVVVDVVENDIHPQDKPLDVVTVDQPENGKCEVTADGKVLYAPNPNFVGMDSCTYTACVENTGACDQANLIVYTTEEPLAEDDNATTPPDTPTTVEVLANDSHPQDETLVVTDVTQPQNGKCEVTADGGVRYTPDSGFLGSDTCTYTACIEKPEILVASAIDICDTADVIVDLVDPIVDEEPPVANDDNAQTIPDTPVVTDVAENDSHPQDKPLEVTTVDQPENGVCLVTADGNVEYTPDAGHVGTDVCTYTICVEFTDICSQADLIVETIDDVDPPLAEDDKTTTPPETPVTVDVTENDSQPQDKPLEVTDVGQPQNGSCERVGNNVQYTPSPGFVGMDACEYTVCVETTEECDTGNLLVEVVDLPVAEDDMAATPPDTPIVISVSKNDSHPQGKPLGVTSVDQPENGMCELVGNDVQYTPNAGFIGTDQCTYTICVVARPEECAQADLVVETLNPPVAENDNATTPPGTPVVVDVSENDSHPQGKPLDVVDVLQPENGTCEVVENNIQYTPDAGFIGSDACAYTICVKSTQVCDNADLIIEVVPEAPTAEDDKARTPIDTPVVSYVVENDSNPSPDKPLEIVSVTPPSNGQCEFSADGYIQYSPSQGFLGTDECTYTVCVDEACDEAKFVIDVVEVKIAEDDKAETPQDTLIIVDVLDNDEHREDPDKPLVVTDTSQPQNGSCLMVENQVQYIPNEGFIGVDQCKYTVCPEENLEECDEGTLVVNVIPTPLANDDLETTEPNVPVLVDVLSNDEPQDPRNPLEVTTVGEPENGSCVLVGSKVEYTPNQDFVGTDQCEYIMCIKGTTNCAPGTVSVDVVPEPVAIPVANDDTEETQPNTPVNVDVLSNDEPQDPNIPLEIVDTTQPENGSCIVVGNEVQYTPNEGFATGSDQCTYTVCVEGTTSCDEGNVIVDVVPSATQKPTNRPSIAGNNRPYALGELLPIRSIFVLHFSFT